MGNLLELLWLELNIQSINLKKEVGTFFVVKFKKKQDFMINITTKNWRLKMKKMT
jgi:hypothetical protein